MNIFEETMKHFKIEPCKHTKEQEKELKRDVEYEKWLDARDMNSEYEQDEPKED